MGTLRLKGFEEYEAILSKMKNGTEEIIGKVTYQGAKVIADEVRKSIQSIPLVQGYGTAEHPLPGGVTKPQKDGLLKGFGISGLQNDGGFYNVKIGFDGYNSVSTDKYPKGQPNQLVARGVESGTSWKRKHPFMRPAVTRAKKRAVEAMKKACDEACEKTMK